MGGTNRATASAFPQGANISSPAAASSKTNRKRKADDALSEEALRLQRKRLSDRRSQRTAREKTRQRIEELEQALEKLSAANAGSKLQEQIAENMALRRENAQLKRRLGHISSLCRIGQ
jgi:succinate dehydrogenase/fumarate reductase flavoprotein subunit